LGKPVWYKHSSLLRTSINYGRKEFYNIGPSGLYYKHITIVNDDSIMTLQVVASPTIVILTTLEVSFIVEASLMTIVM
jgi:hypothetical protein